MIDWCLHCIKAQRTDSAFNSKDVYSKEIEKERKRKISATKKEAAQAKALEMKDVDEGIFGEEEEGDTAAKLGRDVPPKKKKRVGGDKVDEVIGAELGLSPKMLKRARYVEKLGMKDVDEAIFGKKEEADVGPNGPTSGQSKQRKKGVSKVQEDAGENAPASGRDKRKKKRMR